MTKVKTARKQNKNMKNNKNKKTKPKTRPQTTMGPVTRVNTAPVAIGNSILGSQPNVIQTANGTRVVGRDFCFECKATTTAVTSWALVGGMPLSPAVLVTSAVKNFAQMFNKFKINRIAFHYITSSPTTQAGDVMFYYEKDRNGPFIDSSNNSFLPYVLSDPNTLIGPQWMNHSVMVRPVGSWNSTDYGMSSDLNEETDGSIFLFSKTNSANSPGYIIMDYDISFKEMSINPRAGVLPVTRALFNYITAGVSATAVTTSTAFSTPIAGSNPDGTPPVMPSGAAAGDIYKFVTQLSSTILVNPAWVNVAASTLINAKPNATLITQAVDDGYTMYALYTGTSLVFYPSVEAAKASTNWYVYGVSATVTFNLCGLISLVGNAAATQSAY